MIKRSPYVLVYKLILIPTAAEEIESELNKDEIQPLGASRLSAPRNLSAVANAQGWLLHWQHPQQGLNGLRLYTVRWWKEPEHMLVGTAETLESYYQLRHLKEESTFMVQVHAMSNDGELVASPELLIEVPSHRKMRALVIGSTVGILFLVCALCAFLYVKRSCLRHLVAGGGSGDHIKDSDKMNNT